jgi:hypothetical protein
MIELADKIFTTGFLLLVLSGPFYLLFCLSRAVRRIDDWPFLLEVRIEPVFENDWRRLVQLLAPLVKAAGDELSLEERDQNIFIRAVNEPQIEAVVEKLKSEHPPEFKLGVPSVLYRPHGYVQGNAVIWEPLMRVRVLAPDPFSDSIRRDLGGRRGQDFQSREQRGGKHLISAVVPLKEMLGYTKALEALSGGGASYTVEFDRFSPVPVPVEDDQPKRPAGIL